MSIHHVLHFLVFDMFSLIFLGVFMFLITLMCFLALVFRLFSDQTRVFGSIYGQRVKAMFGLPLF